MPWSVRAALIGVVVLLRGAVAQGHPDFSGKWILDEGRSASAHYGGFVGPVVLNIAVTDSEMRVEVTRGDKTTIEVYCIFDSPDAAAQRTHR